MVTWDDVKDLTNAERRKVFEKLKREEIMLILKDKPKVEGFKIVPYDSRKPISRTNPKEIINGRGLHRKIFDVSKKDKVLVCTKNPLHYEDMNGNYQDISTNIENGRVHKCNYDVSLFTDKIGYYGTDPTGKKIELELKGLAYKTPRITKNKALFVNVKRDVDFELTFDPRGIKANIYLKTATADKTTLYRSYREAGAIGKLNNLGVDAKGRNTKLTITEVAKGIDEKEITQVFDGQVMKLNPITRKREWSNQVTYPVKIDPSTFFAGGSGQWNRGFGYPSPYSTIASTNHAKITNLSTGTPYFAKTGAWIRFTGITIPQTSTINSAYFDIYRCNPNYGNGWIAGFNIGTTSNPATPYYARDCTTMSNKSYYGFSTGTATGGGTVTNKNDYFNSVFDVSTEIQSLVTNYDYSNGVMAFYPKTNSYGGDQSAHVYLSMWGTTKEPTLVIDFTPPASGWTHIINTVTAANMARVNSVARANIAKVNAT